MSKEKNSMKNTVLTRSLRAGGYSVLAALILLAALIFVNLIVSSLPAKYVKFDTSTKNLYTFDEQTKEILASVSEDITIYLVAERGTEDSVVTELLDRYASESRYIRIKTVDPAVSPAFLLEYTEDSVSNNSLIVESGRRSKLVPYSEIYKTDYSNLTEEDYYNYYYYGITPQGETVFAGENALTGAIDFVTATKIPKIYSLSGHGETALSETVQGYLKDENFETDTLSLIASSGLDDGFSSSLVTGEVSVPEDASCIFINTPTSDISDEELTALISYIMNGGTVIVTGDWRTVSLPNMVRLAEQLGLDLCGSLVVEGSQGHYYSRAYYLLPDAQSHTITDPIINNGKYVLFANSHALLKSENIPEGVTVTPLFTTTDSAYAKKNTDFENISYESDDRKGPFLSAAAVTAGEGKAVWFASGYICEDSADQIVSGGNSNTFLNAFGWCCEKTSSVSVRTISLSVEPLTVTESSANTWLIIVCILIPLSAVGIGLVIWMRRRAR